METHKACRLTEQTSKRPCLGACCLVTAYIHPVWFLSYLLFFFFVFFFLVQWRLEWSWLHNMQVSTSTWCSGHVFMSRWFFLSIFVCSPIYFTLNVRITIIHRAVMENGTVLQVFKGLLHGAQHMRLMMLNFLYWGCFLSGKQCEHTAAWKDRFRKDWNATSDLRHQQVLLPNMPWI